MRGGRGLFVRLGKQNENLEEPRQVRGDGDALHPRMEHRLLCCVDHQRGRTIRAGGMHSDTRSGGAGVRGMD